MRFHHIFPDQSSEAKSRRVFMGELIKGIALIAVPAIPLSFAVKRYCTERWYAPWTWKFWRPRVRRSRGTAAPEG